MKQEDKQLLLKDLCARFPYGIKVKDNTVHANSIVDVLGIDGKFIIIEPEHRFDSIVNRLPVECVKPYLRPMSSMTEEESETYEQLLKDIHYKPRSSTATKYIDWLNANMFDYRDLIPRGLAIAVTDENNPYKD